MKKIRFHARARVAVLALLTLLALTFILSSCEPEKCLHVRTVASVVDPNCSEEGYILHTCRDCGHTYKSNFVEPLGHVILTVTHAPTCTDEGYTEYVCDRAGCDYAYESDFVEPQGHALVSAVTDPTCTASGFTDYVCEREACNYAFVSDPVPPAGHLLTSVDVAATCTAGGYSVFSCANCGLQYSSAVSAPLGHTFTDVTVRPSIARTGYTTHTCYCGYSYTDSYVWYSDIFTGATVENGTVLATGIDLSFWNEKVDWQALAATGIDYVILRGGSGRQMPDVMFEEHYQNARAVGLDVGCYFYTYATTVEGVLEEAKELLKVLDGKKFEYPIYFDIEDPSLESVDKETLMAMCLAFCQTMTDHGYFPALYANTNWLVNLLRTEEVLALYDLWFARYLYDDGPTTRHDYGTWSAPLAYNMYGMWQYTQYGRIDGITSKVDLNFCYKDYPALIKKYGYNGS